MLRGLTTTHDDRRRLTRKRVVEDAGFGVHDPVHHREEAVSLGRHRELVIELFKHLLRRADHRARLIGHGVDQQ